MTVRVQIADPKGVALDSFVGKPVTLGPNGRVVGRVTAANADGLGQVTLELDTTVALDVSLVGLGPSTGTARSIALLPPLTPDVDRLD